MKAIISLVLAAAALVEHSYSIDPLISQRETYRRRLLPADCIFEGAKLVCDHGFEVVAGPNKLVVVQFTVRCDADSQVRFNYQNANNCQCSARVTAPDGGTKNCACSVCNAGFGDLPVRVDCTQYEEAYLNGTSGVTSTTRSGGTAPVGNVLEPTPFLVGTCTSLDCGGACNGTCNVNCANSGTACPYCAAQNPPTATPTGSGAPTDSGIPVVDKSSVTFSAPGGQTIVCTDSLENVCTASTTCSRNGASSAIRSVILSFSFFRKPSF